MQMQMQMQAHQAVHPPQSPSPASMHLQSPPQVQSLRQLPPQLVQRELSGSTAMVLQPMSSPAGMMQQPPMYNPAALHFPRPVKVSQQLAPNQTSPATDVGKTL